MKLCKIELSGFKSIDETHHSGITLNQINIMLGANGAGKSNLVSFFSMLNFMTTGALSTYVGRTGVEQLLHYGPKHTQVIRLKLHFTDDESNDTYELTLGHGLPDRLFIENETIQFFKQGHDQPQIYSLPAGGAEIGIINDTRTTSRVIKSLLSAIRTFQFHDTSSAAKIRSRGYREDARYLRSDAGNLAAFLAMLQSHEPYHPYYERVVRHVQTVMPQFKTFDLQPLPGNEDYVRLNWIDQSGLDYRFGPDQISDGSLRFMALATLLLQPPDLLPKFIVIDEPELGLHPTAIAELAGMIRTASQHAQILIATQSTRLVDEFDSDQLLIIEHDESSHTSVFKRLNTQQLADWLADYSISELWEKNVLGAQP